jgi:hypothetical protein
VAVADWCRQSAFSLQPSDLSPDAHRQLDAQVREVRRMLASFMQKLTPDG